MEEEIIYNQSRIIIFDSIISNNKKFRKFQGINSNVKLSLGGIEIKCFDHEILCYLVHSQIHNIELILEPIDENIDWGVKIFWTNICKYHEDNFFIIDNTIDEILATVKYMHNMIGVNFELHQEKNKIKRIIKELSNKKFLDDNDQEKKVIEILQSHYDNYKIPSKFFD
jgi:hypothetical protein